MYSLYCGSLKLGANTVLRMCVVRSWKCISCVRSVQRQPTPVFEPSSSLWDHLPKSRTDFFSWPYEARIKFLQDLKVTGKDTLSLSHWECVAPTCRGGLSQLFTPQCTRAPSIFFSQTLLFSLFLRCLCFLSNVCLFIGLQLPSLNHNLVFNQFTQQIQEEREVERKKRIKENGRWRHVVQLGPI